MLRHMIQTGKNGPLLSYPKQFFSGREQTLLTRIAQTEIRIGILGAKVFMPSHESVFIAGMSHIKQGTELKSPMYPNGNKSYPKSGCALTVQLEAIVQQSARARVHVRTVENDITPRSAKRHKPKLKKRPYLRTSEAKVCCLLLTSR